MVFLKKHRNVQHATKHSTARQTITKKAPTCADLDLRLISNSGTIFINTSSHTHLQASVLIRVEV